MLKEYRLESKEYRVGISFGDDRIKKSRDKRAKNIDVNLLSLLSTL
jgi:hypothetical protein